VITTTGSEIAENIVKAGAGIGVKNGNIQELSNAILTLSKNKIFRNKLTKNAEKLLKSRYSAKICMTPLKLWLKNPKKAAGRPRPGRQKKGRNPRAAVPARRVRLA
jgi:glycosyltransferase involved in cell wall biosynthesis